MKTKDGLLELGTVEQLGPELFCVHATDAQGYGYTLQVQSDDVDQVLPHAGTEPMMEWARDPK